MDVALWRRGEHALFLGDGLEVMSALPPGGAALVLADPPPGRAAGAARWVDLAVERLRPDGALVVIAAPAALAALEPLIAARLEVTTRVVWRHPPRRGGRGRPAAAWTGVLHAARGERWVYDAAVAPTDVWDIDPPGADEDTGHPEQRPEALIDRIVRAWTAPGDLIVDPFAGVFTTTAVAARLGRPTVAIERDPAWVEVGARRVGAAPA